MHRSLADAKSGATVSLLLTLLVGCSQPRQEGGPSSAPDASGDATQRTDAGDGKPVGLEILSPFDEALFPPDIVADQISIGATKEGFLAEALGLYDLPKNDLSQVAALQFDTDNITHSNYGTTLPGQVVLTDGSVKQAEILLDQDLKLTSAVG